MLRFVTRSLRKYTQKVHLTRTRAIDSRTTVLARGSPRLVESDFGTCGKKGYGESDSSKMGFGRVRLGTCRV